MKLYNPQTFAYHHQNFGEGKTSKASLNQDPDVQPFLSLDVEMPDGSKGGAQLQAQDNGTWVIRIHRDENNPLRVLVVGPDGGTLFEG